jgi:hypothetical protein
MTRRQGDRLPNRARHVPHGSTHFPAADLDRTRQAVKCPGVLENGLIPPPADVGHDTRHATLDPGIAASPRPDDLFDRRRVIRTDDSYVHRHSTILLRGYSTMPSA